MSKEDTNQASEDKPTNQHLVCLWQLQDIEETIADAAPEELVDLHSKLVALSTDITEAVQSAIRTEKLKLLAEVRKLQKSYLSELTSNDDDADYDDFVGTHLSALEKLEAEL